MLEAVARGDREREQLVCPQILAGRETRGAAPRQARRPAGPARAAEGVTSRRISPHEHRAPCKITWMGPLGARDVMSSPPFGASCCSGSPCGPPACTARSTCAGTRARISCSAPPWPRARGTDCSTSRGRSRPSSTRRWCPLVVAAFERALGTSDYLVVGPWLRRCYFVLSGVYLLAAYVVVRGWLAPPLALVAIAGTGLSFYSFLYPSDSLYAEIPFALARDAVPPVHWHRARRAGWGRRRGARGAGVSRSAPRASSCSPSGSPTAWCSGGTVRPRSAPPWRPCRCSPGRRTSRASRTARPTTTRRTPTSARRTTTPTSPMARTAGCIDPFQPELGRTSPRGLAGRVGRNLLALPRSIGESMWIAVGSAPYFLDKVQRGLRLPLAPAAAPPGGRPPPASCSASSASPRSSAADCCCAAAPGCYRSVPGSRSA